MSDGAQLGTLLCQRSLITQAQLDAALAEQATSGKPLGRVLIEHGHISETDLVRTLAEQVGLEFVDLSERSIDPSVAGLIPEHLARKYQALPVGWDDDGRLVVAMGDPSNVFAVDDIRALTGADIYTVVATAGQLQDSIDRFHRLDGEVDTMAQEAADELERRRRPRERQRGHRGRADRQVRQPADHAGGAATARRTSTSSRPRRTCASGSASTACCTRSCTRRSRSRPA